MNHDQHIEPLLSKLTGDNSPTLEEVKETFIGKAAKDGLLADAHPNNNWITTAEHNAAEQAPQIEATTDAYEEDAWVLQAGLRTTPHVKRDLGAAIDASRERNALHLELFGT